MSEKQLTENKEFDIDNLTPPDKVDYFIYRLETGRWKKVAKAWMIATILVFVAFVVSNVLWIVYENQFEDVEVSQEVTQTTDQGGNNTNTLYTGDYNGYTDSQNDSTQANP